MTLNGGKTTSAPYCSSFIKSFNRSINRKLSTARQLICVVIYSLYLPFHHIYRQSPRFHTFTCWLSMFMCGLSFAYGTICLYYLVWIILTQITISIRSKHHIYTTRIYLLNFAHNGTLNVLNTNTRVSVIDGIM